MVNKYTALKNYITTTPAYEENRIVEQNIDARIYAVTAPPKNR
jgi:hypothetical protein